jgi:D-cysteine desulfhydrase
MTYRLRVYIMLYALLLMPNTDKSQKMTIDTRLIDWPARLNLASLPTPLHKLERLSKQLGGPNIWLKRDDLTGCLLSGNKVRKLEFIAAHAQARHKNVFITCGGLQSNHARATAFVGAQLGVPVHLVLRGLPADSKQVDLDANLLLDHLAGAKVDYYEEHYYQQNLKKILCSTAQRYRQRGYDPYIIPTGASDGIGLWGYIAACEELASDFEKHNITPNLIVTATGSGGTQAGLTVGAELYDFGCNVLGLAVCDDATYFSRKVAADISEFVSLYQDRFTNALSQVSSECLPATRSDPFSRATARIRTNDGYVGAGYGIVSDAVLETIIKVAQLEGIVFDPVYTGKAFHGLIQMIKTGQLEDLENIVFVHTGGGFGVFPYRQRFADLMSY